jgi:hypothetical protein
MLSFIPFCHSICFICIDAIAPPASNNTVLKACIPLSAEGRPLEAEVRLWNFSAAINLHNSIM